MATLLTENFETGPSGAAITSTNTVASTVVVGTGNTQTFDPTNAVDPELLGLKVTLGATNASLSEFQFTAQSGRVVARLEKFGYLTAGASFRPICWRNTTPGNAGHLLLNGSGQLVLLTSTGTTVTGSTSTTTLTAGSFYDLEVAITRGTTISDGIIEYRVYPNGSGTALETKTITGQNTGTVDVNAIRLGTSAAASAAQTWWGDNLRVDTLVSGWIGLTILPPVLNTQQYDDYTIIDARGSTAGAGGTLTYTITPTAGVIEAIEGVFLVPRASTDTVYTITTHESGTNLTDNTPTVTVPALNESNFRILNGNGTSYV